MAEVIDRSKRETAERDTQIRGLTARDGEDYRKFQWRPADALPMPKAPPGIRYRYIRKSVAGEPDVNNYGRAMREGWVPVQLSDHPELESSVEATAKVSGLIEIGALILCKIPQEVADARNAYYANLTNRQMEAVDNNLMRENDPRMPLFNNRDTKVSFGDGK